MIAEPVHCGAADDSAALADVLTRWKADHPAAGILALVAEADKAHVPALQGLCRDLDISLVGAIFPALVDDSGFKNKGLSLLRLDVMPAAFLLPAVNAPGPRGEDAAAKIAAAVEPCLGDEPAALFMIFDALVPNIASILDGLYLRLADRVHYMGVNAGSETFQPMPCLFDRDDVVADGVWLLLLPGHPGAILDHGYLAPKDITVATGTEGNRIVSIDWQPAFEVYRKLIHEHYGATVTRENFYQYATHFPFGILRANEEVVVRIPVALEADGSLFCVGEVPVNAMLTLLKAAEADSSSTVKTVADGLTALNGPMAGRLVATFYCAGRRMHMGEGSAEELNRLATAIGASHLVGALSLGEIGSSSEGGYPLFHNATLVCFAWAGS